MARPEDLDPLLADLASAVERAVAAAELPPAPAEFERPKQADHGDWATTLALRLAKPAKRAPRDIAQAVVDHLELPDAVAAVGIAGPGFINFTLAPSHFENLVRRVVAEGPDYGSRTLPEEAVERVNVEFVSANPTGPLHIGNGRWAATGDAIAALLAAGGHDTTREYYLNDAGGQLATLGVSVLRVAHGLPLEDGDYRGDYVEQIAQRLRADHGEAFLGDPAVVAAGEIDDELALEVGRAAADVVREQIEASLHQMGVDFDVWFSERSLHDSGAIEKVIEDLVAKGRTREEDDALFLVTTEFGDDKDRVLVRSNGVPTYFAADCAYMADKWGRGFDRLIYLLGADHHGYVARLGALGQCLGIPEDRLEIRIGQLVNLLDDGQPVKMSKRSGAFETLEDVLTEVGGDVTRYHFLRQSLDTALDFDLAQVARQSMDNPVYYVQYAHARIASLVRTADERDFAHGDLADADLSRLTEPAEVALLKRMAELPDAVAAAGELRATQRLARYAEDLAGAFHRFYADCRVLVEDEELGRARYWLAVAAKQVLANALALLRVSAPERM